MQTVMSKSSILWIMCNLLTFSFSMNWLLTIQREPHVIYETEPFSSSIWRFRQDKFAHYRFVRQQTLSVIRVYICHVTNAPKRDQISRHQNNGSPKNWILTTHLDVLVGVISAVVFFVALVLLFHALGQITAYEFTLWTFERHRESSARQS